MYITCYYASTLISLSLYHNVIVIHPILDQNCTIMLDHVTLQWSSSINCFFSNTVLIVSKVWVVRIKRVQFIKLYIVSVTPKLVISTFWSNSVFC